MNNGKEKIKEQLIFEFEPEFDIQDDEWLGLEDQILEVTAEKFGNEYTVSNYYLETKMIVTMEKGDNGMIDRRNTRV